MGIIEDIAAGIARIEAKVDALGGSVPPPPPPPDPKPVAGFSASPVSGIAPLMVKFTDESAHATAVTYVFGDGTNSNDRNPTHVYATPGTFSVQQQVSGPGGTDSKLVDGMIVVEKAAEPPPPPPPPPDPTGDPPIPADTKGWKIEIWPSPAPGKGPPMTGGLGAAMKHSRWVYCPTDQKFYIFGGDYWNPFRPYDSGAHLTQTYDPASGAWEIVYAFGNPGELSPTGNDEVGVAYDASRDVFWLVCGYQWNTVNEAPGPDIAATRLHNVVLCFDRKTRKWIQPFATRAAFIGQDGSPARAVYDEVLDRVVAWRYDAMFWLDCKTGTAGKKPMMVPGLNFFLDKGIHFRKGRWVYVVGFAKDTTDGVTKGVLCRANIDTYTAEMVTWLPTQFGGGGIDFPLNVDTNEALLWGPAPALGSWLLNVETKEIKAGPPNPLTLLGNPFMPNACNYHPPTKKFVLGWSVFSTTNEEKPYRCYHYSVEQPPAPPPGEL